MSIQIRPKLSVYIATSIDGYIARKDHSLDWLEHFSPPVENSNEDYGFKNFLETIDTVVMGKNTYKVAESAGPKAWPYGDKRVIVLSKTLSSVYDKAEIYNGDIAKLIDRLHADGIKHIYVDGGNVISQYLNMGLIDELIISIIPIILGSGIHLFNNILSETRCRLITSKFYSNSLIQLKYAINKA